MGKVKKKYPSLKGRLLKFSSHPIQLFSNCSSTTTESKPRIDLASSANQNREEEEEEEGKGMIKVTSLSSLQLFSSFSLLLIPGLPFSLFSYGFINSFIWKEQE